ncbi:unnamed protein product [Trifolium pratense]|uniref:Uncharacterized protein n=1 Tax=Trifolium pratense TaxID=57577 RepID=A0ACB0JPS8_TRIPR|nr:unnamed protein product [Trifolium pratense]
MMSSETSPKHRSEAVLKISLRLLSSSFSVVFDFQANCMKQDDPCLAYKTNLGPLQFSLMFSLMDTLRTDWTTWKQLIGKETGLGWNHATGNIDADPSWWEAKIRENVKYAKFRYQGLEFRDEMEFIFGEAVATSQYQWTPALGVPSESNINNTTTNVPHEIIESDDSGYNDEDLTLVENTQFKKKRKIVSNMGEKAAKGRAKVGTASAMRKTFERLVEAAEDHNDVEKAGIATTSHVHGQYSIPDCVKLLKKAKDEGFLNSQQFSYALEMLKDEQNRVLLISLKESKDDLVEWILYKYAEKKSSNN